LIKSGKPAIKAKPGLGWPWHCHRPSPSHGPDFCAMTKGMVGLVTKELRHVVPEFHYAHLLLKSAHPIIIVQFHPHTLAWVVTTQSATLLAHAPNHKILRTVSDLSARPQRLASTIHDLISPDRPLYRTLQPGEIEQLVSRTLSCLRRRRCKTKGKPKGKPNGKMGRPAAMNKN
jgi:hypothetical protein